jgi:cytoskeletal protein RodZ
VKRNHVLLLVVALGAVVVWVATSWSPIEHDGAEAPAPLPTAEQAEPPPAAPPLSTPTTPSNQPAAPTPEAPQPTAATPTPTAPAEEPSNKPTPLPPPQRSGRVDELEKRFNTEHRDSAAPTAESAVEASFRRPEVQPGLLKSVQCRASVCKVETRWTTERAVGFMAAFMDLVLPKQGQEPPPFKQDLAIAPAEKPDADGSLAVDVYVERVKPAP